jgi:hypothetical protein
MALTPGIEPGDHLRNRRLSLMLLIVSSVLAISWSFVSARQALWALVLNFAAPTIAGWGRKSS